LDNVTCPFATKACLGEAVIFDTDKISSQDLGINTPSNEEVHFRKTLTCAPLATEQYSSEWTTEEKPIVQFLFGDLQPGDAYKYYKFGGLRMDATTRSEHTFALSNNSYTRQDQAYKLL
jgi:hypothetical protein